jgi:predicted nucleic acid-binding protein
MGQDTKFTPGEWEARLAPDGLSWTVRSVYTDELGRRNTSWPAICHAAAQHNEANAHMISAAPDMYEALKLASEALGKNAAYDAVMAALAKARGEQ